MLNKFFQAIIISIFFVFLLFSRSSFAIITPPSNLQQQKNSVSYPAGTWFNTNTIGFWMNKPQNSGNWLSPNTGIIVNIFGLGNSYFNLLQTSPNGSNSAYVQDNFPEGRYWWQAQTYDYSGDYSQWAYFSSPDPSEMDFGIDTTGPTGTLSINNNALYTNTRDVTLNLSANDTLSGLKTMAMGYDLPGGGFWSTFEMLFQSSYNWTLTEGDGLKTVYVMYKDNADNYVWIPDSIILDTTAPQITSTSPVGLATDVPLNSIITADFNDNLDQTSVIGANVDLVETLNPTNHIPVGVNYVDVNKRVVIDPVSDLAPLTQYTATIKTGIKDKAGNNLASDYSWSFTTVKPDLVIESITPSNPNPDTGEQVDINIKVNNQGLGDAGSFWLNFYDTPSQPPSQGQDSNNSIMINSLTAGSSITYPFNESWNSPGLHQIYAQVDYNNMVSESDEANNVSGPINLNVYNNSPKAALTVNLNPGLVGQPITFDASSSSHGRPDRSIVKYEFDFDYQNNIFTPDYTEQQGNAPDGVFDGITRQSFPLPGTRPIAVRVTDNNPTPMIDIEMVQLQLVSVQPITVTSPDNKISRSSISIKVSSKIIKSGSIAKIAGKVKDAVGKAIANVKVILKAKVLNKAKGKGKSQAIKAKWKTLGVVTTNAKGEFKFKHKPKQTTIYKAQFAGDTTYSASSSKEVKVIVKKAKKK